MLSPLVLLQTNPDDAAAEPPKLLVCEADLLKVRVYGWGGWAPTKGQGGVCFLGWGGGYHGRGQHCKVQGFEVAGFRGGLSVRGLGIDRM